jgi:hypothetical protein
MTDYEVGQDEKGGLRTRLLAGIQRAFAAENDTPTTRPDRTLIVKGPLTPAACNCC